MTRTRHVLGIALATILLSTWSRGDGAVWVVDDQAGPGVDFTTIQAAVDAADDGDAIVVHAGTYASFSIVAKDLTVVGVPGAEPDLEDNAIVSVSGLGPQQAVAIRGVPGGSSGSRSRVVLSANEGAVWLENLTLQPGPLEASIDVSGCDGVVVAGCQVTGLPGLMVADSSVSVSGSFIAGLLTNVAAFEGKNHGIVVSGATSQLVLAGSRAEGGPGGFFNGSTCPAIDGGDGLRVTTGARAYLLDSELAGGFTGSPSCPGNPVPGLPLRVMGGLATTLVGSANPFERSIPEGPFASARGFVGGQVGDLIYVFGAARPAFVYFPSLQGAILVSPSTVTSVEIPGYVERARELVFQSPTPALPPGRDFTRSFQQVALERTDGSVRIGGPSLQVVFDPAFGVAPDCDQSGRSDTLEIARELGDDCNGNGVIDACDIASGFSLDCDLDGIPDDCAEREPDCDGNGIPDPCDVAAGAADCNANAIPDGCEGGWLFRGAPLDPSLEPGDAFGTSVALDGEWLVVGNEEDRRFGGRVTGSVSLFRQDAASGDWTFFAKLVPEDAASGDAFGAVVALSGSTLAVSAPGHGTDGAVYLYGFLSAFGVWARSDKLLPSSPAAGDSYGTALALQEGSLEKTLAVGAPTQTVSGRVYVYRAFPVGPWSELQQLTPASGPIPGFGSGLALDGDDLLVCGDENDAFMGPENTIVYSRGAGTMFGSPQPLTTTGRSVSMDGDLLAVGRAEQPRTVELFERDGGGVWQPRQSVEASSVGSLMDFGRTVALAGNQLVVGDPGLFFSFTDSAHVFEEDAGGVFVPLQSLEPVVLGTSSEGYGDAIAFDGDDLVLGAYRDDVRGTDSGAIHTYRPTFDRNLDGTPDECQLLLTQDSYTPGGDLVLSTFGGLEGDAIAFFFSESGTGMGPCLVPGAACFDILDPILSLGSATVDRFGETTLAAPVDGDPIFVQAVNVRSLSPPVLIYSGVLAAP